MLAIDNSSGVVLRLKWDVQCSGLELTIKWTRSDLLTETNDVVENG